MENVITNSSARYGATERRSSVAATAIFKIDWDKLAYNYYAIISFTLIVSSCLGGIAAMYILKNNAPIGQLIACSFISMFNNTTAIGNMPIKWVTGSFVLSIIVNTALILINIF